MTPERREALNRLLIETVLNSYHRTRVTSDAVEFILSDQRVKDILEIIHQRGVTCPACDGDGLTRDHEPCFMCGGTGTRDSA